MPRRILYAVVLTLVLPPSTFAAEEPLMDTLRDRFQSEPLKVGALVQVVGVYDSADSALVNRGFEPNGYHVTAGFKPADDTRLLLRWDSFTGDGTVADSDLIIIGLNHWPTSPTEVQLNAVFPTRGGRDLQLLANVQVGF